jgi:prepilin-type N-terminal cleavage/methylation domain-containing protein/prepilin-type processing-associated H-X9-DG protein
MKNAAFTLIEMLVVITIVGLLLGILFPCLQHSKQAARAVVCGSNIKQLTLGLTMYESDNKTFPYGMYNTSKTTPTTFFGNLAYDKLGLWWMNYITKYTKKNTGEDSIIWCPARNITDSKFKTNVLDNNYGVNISVCKKYSDYAKISDEFNGTPLGIDDIKRPSETLLILDSGYSIIRWHNATDLPPVQFDNSMEDASYVPGLKINKNKKLMQVFVEDAISGRHPNKTINAGYTDGHIDRIKADTLLVEKDSDTYKNLTPLWQP